MELYPNGIYLDFRKDSPDIHKLRHIIRDGEALGDDRLSIDPPEVPLVEIAKNEAGVESNLEHLSLQKRISSLHSISLATISGNQGVFLSTPEVETVLDMSVKNVQRNPKLMNKVAYRRLGDASPNAFQNTLSKFLKDTITVD